MSSSRDQYYKPKTSDHQVVRFILLFAFIAIALVGIFLFSKRLSRYEPPEFDSNAKTGIPTPDDSYMFSSLKTDYGYSFSLAANLYQQENGDLFLYLTNSDSNEINLMCEITDNKTGKTLYKSGVIKPGEYIEKLSPEFSFPNIATEVSVSIYAFEPDVWYSAGTTTLSSILQPW